MVVVPTPRDGYPDETVRVALEGRTYIIRWLWNEREGIWTFSISDSDGVAILSGVRVVLNMDLLAMSVDERLPGGRLFMVDPSGGTEEPTQASLGTSCLPVYATAAELEVA